MLEKARCIVLHFNKQLNVSMSFPYVLLNSDRHNNHFLIKWLESGFNRVNLTDQIIFNRISIENFPRLTTKKSAKPLLVFFPLSEWVMSSFFISNYFPGSLVYYETSLTLNHAFCFLPLLYSWQFFFSNKGLKLSKFITGLKVT